MLTPMNNTMHSILLQAYQIRFPGEEFILKGQLDRAHANFKQMYDDFIDQDPENITWNYVSEYALCTKNYKTCLFLILALLD